MSDTAGSHDDQWTPLTPVSPPAYRKSPPADYSVTRLEMSNQTVDVLEPGLPGSTLKFEVLSSGDRAHQELEFTACTDPEKIQDFGQIAYEFIESTLAFLGQEGAFGTMIQAHIGPRSQYCIVIGCPEPHALRDYNTAAINFPVLIIKDKIDTVASVPSVKQLEWQDTPTSGCYDTVSLRNMSLGQEGDINEAGSFGGWFRSAASADEFFGLTAAHCLPNAQFGSYVVAPSTLELMQSFLANVTYSDLLSESNPIRGGFRQVRTKEAERLFSQYEKLASPNGVVLDGRNIRGASQMEPFVLTGGKLGEVLIKKLIHHAPWAINYNQRLTDASLRKLFTVPSDTDTTSPIFSALDYLLFKSSSPERVGGNTRANGEQIIGMALLQPGDIVFKTGRTTGTTHGEVNGFQIMTWSSGAVTHEIGVVGVEGSIFGRKGDSGSLVAKVGRNFDQAAGLVIGASLAEGFTCVTPLVEILEDIERETGEAFMFS